MQLRKAVRLTIVMISFATASAVPYGQSWKLTSYKLEMGSQCGTLGDDCYDSSNCCWYLFCRTVPGDAWCDEWPQTLGQLEATQYHTRHAYRVLQGKRDIEHTELMDFEDSTKEI
ncbi:hypothetical protein C8R43DRAFT_957730 [Mycena crocata]|nr:hypothetical protein C8R43DRAFT_957730 [Mycena crocata]